jgi:hypothetical protein
VRLSREELSTLDRYGESQGVTHRSDAVRRLIRSALEPPRQTPELPVSLQSQLEELVAQGWASDLDAALTLVLTRGLEQLSEVIDERFAVFERTARSLADKRAQRRRADREGRGLLER